MNDTTPERFRALAGERFRFLEEHGFRRSPADEHESPVGSSVVYAGKHVGFRISFDVRDAQVDVQVMRAREGRLLPPGAGGHATNLLVHLVRHAGYRGGLPGLATGEVGPEPVTPERILDAWAGLLIGAGSRLLTDEAGALPSE